MLLKKLQIFRAPDLVTKNDLIFIKNKISNKSNIASKSDLTAVENKIPNINNLATKTALTAIENKIPNVSNLVKKKQTKNKLNSHDKYIDTSEFNKLASDVFNARIAQANLVKKTNFDAKSSSFNRKSTQNKSKHLIVQNELNKLITFDSSYFIGKCRFREDGTQNYLVFQPMNTYLKTDNSDYVLSWTSKGLSNGNITLPSTHNNFFSPSLNYLGTKIRIKLSGSCLKQDKITYTHGKTVNIYIVNEINKKDNTIISDTTLENCLFGAVTLTKHVNIYRYVYSGYGIGFDRKGEFSFSGGEYGQNVLIFGVDVRSFIHIDHKKKTLVLGFGPTQGLEHTLTAEKMYSINFTEKNNKF